jgi:hypothetical protein
VNLCPLLPIPSADVWSNPHIYGTIGASLGAAIGLSFAWRLKGFMATLVMVVCCLLGIVIGTLAAAAVRQYCPG